MFNPLKRRRKPDQKGSSLIIMALSLSALMFTGGVVVDLGSYYSQASRLQNAADAAAAAGASVYVKNGTTRLISVSNDFNEDDGFTYKMDGQTFSFTPVETSKDEADELAEDYVSKNSNENVVTSMVSRLWEDTTTSTLANGNSVSYTNAYAYRVDLTDTVDLYFSRLFGLDSYPTQASAMAIFVTEPDEDNIDDFIEEISANIYNTIPNYYWEAIHGTSSIKINNGSQSSTRAGYGNQSSVYFTTDYGTYVSKGMVTIKNISSSDHLGNVLAYKYTSQPITEKWCADPITGSDTIGLTKMVYTLNKKLIQETVVKNGKNVEITGLFLDRPNINHNSNGIQGSKVRATELNITSESISDDNSVPLYMRFESEPRKIGSSVTFTQPIIINVEGKQKKPLVIAYDGPDALRTKSDAPTVDVSTGKAGNPGVYAAASSSITPPPYILNLNDDFNGVIYAPFSKITITGSGKIVGFVLAKEIVDSSFHPATRKTLTAETVTLPTWGNNKNSLYSYDVQNITGQYTVIYDEFYNYTKTASNI